MKVVLDRRFGLLTNAHDNAVTVSPRVKHVIFRFGNEVAHHLDSLCIHELDVFFFAHGFCELLSNEFSEFSPLRVIIHEKHVMALRNELL